MKFSGALFLLAAGVAAVVWTLASPPRPTGDRHDRPVEGGDRPALSAPAAEPVGAQDEPAPFLRRGKHVSANGIGTERNFLGEIRDWARNDPEAALAWAQKQPDSDEARKEALTDACFQIAETEPQRALMLAARFKLSRDSVLQNLAQQWGDKDLPSACRWIAQQEDDDQRNALVTGVTFVWSQTAPADAARFVVEQMTPGSARDAAVMMVIHQWASVDAGGASAWARQFPEGPLREQILGELASLSRQRAGDAP